MAKITALDDGEDSELDVLNKVLEEYLKKNPPAEKKKTPAKTNSGFPFTYEQVIKPNSFPGHKGRPGQRGGSLPRSGGSAGIESKDTGAKEYPEYKEGKAADLIAGSSKLDPDLKGYITIYTEKEYQDMGAKIYLSDDGKSGFAVKPSGELISVYSTERGRGRELMDNAVKAGAKSLDCYEDPNSKHLTKLYGKYGFKETERLKWDDQYAPDGWNYERFDNPDVVFMKR